MITSIIGVETRYGKVTGSYRVLDTLVTLAFNYPKRAALFRRELEHYLLLTREVGLSPLNMRGSFAGAIGLAQFMPTSYRRYGVDFDGDGKCDLSTNPVDAIGSVANYFVAHGWKTGEPVAVRAQLTGNPGQPPDTRRSLDAWKKLGVVPTEEVPSDLEAVMISLQTKEGTEYWLGFRNFHVITRYNNSIHYAMAVYELSREILALQRQGKPAESEAAGGEYGTTR